MALNPSNYIHVQCSVGLIPILLHRKQCCTVALSYFPLLCYLVRVTKLIASEEIDKFPDEVNNQPSMVPIELVKTLLLWYKENSK